MKKLFIIFILLLLSFIITILLKFDSNIIIYVYDYEIFTNTKFIFLLIISLILLIFLLTSCYYTIINNNKEKIEKAIKKTKQKYELYINNLYNSILYSLTGETNKSNNYIEKSKKIIDNNFTDLIKSQILIKENNFNEAIKFNNTNNKLVEYNLYLSKAICENDLDKIEYYSKEILKIQKNNNECIKILYNVNKNKNNWINCLNLINKMKKQLTKEEINNELIFLYNNLSKDYFVKKDYKNSLIYSLKVFSYNKSLKDNNNVILQSLKQLNNKQLLKYIEKIWKFTPSNEFGKMYLENQKNKIKAAKKLYNINKKDIISIIFYCNILIENNKIILINDDIINELNKYHYKEVFEILLKLEEKEKANSLLINSLKEKILSSESIY